MFRVEVDHASSVPPYQQVAAELRNRVESGQIAPGSRLPSIADLVQQYGIARTTAAKALHVLVNEGMAVISPGMGTFAR